MVRFHALLLAAPTPGAPDPDRAHHACSMPPPGGPLQARSCAGCASRRRHQHGDQLVATGRRLSHPGPAGPAPRLNTRPYGGPVAEPAAWPGCIHGGFSTGVTGTRDAAFSPGGGDGAAQPAPPTSSGSTAPSPAITRRFGQCHRGDLLLCSPARHFCQGPAAGARPGHDPVSPAGCIPTTKSRLRAGQATTHTTKGGRPHDPSPRRPPMSGIDLRVDHQARTSSPRTATGHRRLESDARAGMLRACRQCADVGLR